MKILHISFADTGGAGLCCLRIHNSLIEQGVESKVVVFKKSSDNIGVYRYGSRGAWWLDTVLSLFLDWIGIRVTARSKAKGLRRMYNAPYSHPSSPIDLTKCELLEWADIIHLHWVNYYIDYPSFFQSVRKPIVWTLHDENLFLGAAHYTRNVVKDCDIEKRIKELKNKIIAPLNNLSVVFLSEYMYKSFHNSPIVINKRQVVINNSVDFKKFVIHDQQSMRRKYNIAQEMIVFAFMAYDIFDQRKGLTQLVTAILNLSIDKKIMVLAIGGYDTSKTVPEVVRPIGYVNNVDEICQLLCCSDYFALPSFQEGFAQSPVEAMACGLPVIAYPCSGTREVINSNNGIICDDFSIDALQKGISLLISRNYNSETIRQGVINRFSPYAIASQYMTLYNEILRSNEQ